jgi:hypothetical protein
MNSTKLFYINALRMLFQEERYTKEAGLFQFETVRAGDKFLKLTIISGEFQVLLKTAGQTALFYM